MRYLTIIFILMTPLLSVTVPALAQDAATGTVEGEVVNGTENGGSVAGVELTLIEYVDDMPADTQTTVADADGYFRFGNVIMEHDYVISANYMGVDYYYPVSFNPGETTATVEVGVCDITDSDQAITIDLAHTVIEISSEDIQVMEIIWLYNDSDMTYAGENALIFQLPPGAYGFQAPQELLPDFELRPDNTAAYLVPFPPGERQLVYSYRLAKPATNELTLPLLVSYPTTSLEVLIAGEGIEAATSQLAPANPVVLDTGNRYIHFQGKDLPRYREIDIQLSNLSGDSSPSLVILWIAIAVVAAGAVIYFISRKKTTADE